MKRHRFNKFALALLLEPSISFHFQVVFELVELFYSVVSYIQSLPTPVRSFHSPTDLTRSLIFLEAMSKRVQMMQDPKEDNPAFISSNVWTFPRIICFIDRLDIPLFTNPFVSIIISSFPLSLSTFFIFLIFFLFIFQIPRADKTYPSFLVSLLFHISNL